jgi:hypothetical protein
MRMGQHVERARVALKIEDTRRYGRELTEKERNLSDLHPSRWSAVSHLDAIPRLAEIEAARLH